MTMTHFLPLSLSTRREPSGDPGVAPAAAPPTASAGSGGTLPGSPQPVAGQGNPPTLIDRVNAAAVAEGGTPVVQPQAVPVAAVVPVPPPTDELGTVRAELAEAKRQREELQRQTAEMQHWAQFGQTYWRQQQAAAHGPVPTVAEPARPSITGVPAYDPMIEQLLSVDASGNITGPPEAVAKHKQYSTALQGFLRGFAQDPAKYLAPLIDQRAKEQAQEIVRAEFARVQSEAAVQKFVGDNFDRLYEIDPATRQPKRDWQGNAALGEYGKQVFRVAAYLDGVGVKDQRAQIELAEQLIKAQSPAAPATPAAPPPLSPPVFDPAAAAAAARAAFLGNPTALTPPAPAQPPPVLPARPGYIPPAPGATPRLNDYLRAAAPAMGMDLNGIR